MLRNVKNLKLKTYLRTGLPLLRDALGHLQVLMAQPKYRTQWKSYFTNALGFFEAQAKACTKKMGTLAVLGGGHQRKDLLLSQMVFFIVLLSRNQSKLRHLIRSLLQQYFLVSQTQTSQTEDEPNLSFLKQAFVVAHLAFEFDQSLAQDLDKASCLYAALGLSLSP